MQNTKQIVISSLISLTLIGGFTTAVLLSSNSKITNKNNSSLNSTSSIESTNTISKEEKTFTINWFVDNIEVFCDSKYSSYSNYRYEFVFPLPVEKEGFIFVGWYENDTSLIKQLNGSENRDLKLYARYNRCSFVSSFKSQNCKADCNNTTRTGTIGIEEKQIILFDMITLLDCGYTYCANLSVEEDSNPSISLHANGAHTTKYTAKEVYELTSYETDNSTTIFTNSLSTEIAGLGGRDSSNTATKKNYEKSIEILSDALTLSFSSTFSIKCGSAGGSCVCNIPAISIVGTISISL